MHCIYPWSPVPKPPHWFQRQRLLVLFLVVSLFVSLQDWHLLNAAPAQRPAAQITPGCIDLIEGGTFEQYSANWLTLQSPNLPSYTNERTFNSSTQSLRLGNSLGTSPNVQSVSEVRYKSLQLPIGATSIILRFRYYPAYEANPGADLQEADLYDATTEQLLRPLLSIQTNDQDWRLGNFDLTPFAGRIVSLRFRVRNDGQLGRKLMYLDNVEIEYCAQAPLPTNTATPTATPTATGLAPFTPTPTPTATSLTPTPIVTVPPGSAVPTPDPSCVNLLANSGFESWDAWHFGEDPVPPVYIGEPRVDGARAVLLGNPPGGAPAVVTFSSIRQLVTLPFTTGRLELRWWKLLRTEQQGAAGQFADRQDLILLSSGLQPIQILRRELRNDNVWVQDVVDLTPYRGQSLYIYFNAYNDGNNSRTWMYLDDVRLNSCGGVIATPYAAAAAPTAAIPLTPIGAPTQTPPPPAIMSATPTVPAAVIQALSPTPTTTATTVVALIEVPSPTPSLTAPPMTALTETSTAAVYALPTQPPPLQVDTATPESIGAAQQAAPALATALPAAPLITTPVATVAADRAQWMDRIGPIAVLTGILVLIGIIVWAIIRAFRRNPAASP